MDLESNEDDMISVVSSGMKRKLSLSMALMGKADVMTFCIFFCLALSCFKFEVCECHKNYFQVLILDEPTAGLDFLSKQKIWNLLTVCIYYLLKKIILNTL